MQIMTKKVYKTVYAYLVVCDGYEDSVIVSDPYDQVMLSVRDVQFEGDARHIRQWAKENGFDYLTGCAEVAVNTFCQE